MGKFTLFKKNTMVNRIILYFLLFFVALLITGEAYLSYIDESIYMEDYDSYKIFHSEKELQYFLSESYKSANNHNVGIFITKSQVNGRSSVSYDIYASELAKNKIQKKIIINKSNEEVGAFLTGKRTIKFHKYIDYNINKYGNVKDSEAIICLIGTKKDADLVYQELAEKCIMSYPREAGKIKDAFFIILLSWSLIFVIVIISEIAYILGMRREIAIKLINGTHRSKEKKEHCVRFLRDLCIAGITAVILMNKINNALKFWKIEIVVFLAIIIAVFGAYAIVIGNINPNEAYKKSIYGKGMQKFFIISCSILLIIVLIALPITINNIDDVRKTYDQEKTWEKYSDYSNVYFSSKGETAIANSDTDKKYAREFFNNNINKYNVIVFQNFAKNGGIYSIDTDNNILYANKNAIEQIKDLIDFKIKSNSFYIISNRVREELLKDDDFRNDVELIFSEKIGKEVVNGQFVQINKTFKCSTLDINFSNLGDNHYKNPIIILDTYDRMQIEKEYSTFLLNSIIKVSNKDFYSYIDEINYNEENYYIENVKKIYNQKKSEKTVLLVLNMVIMALLMILFNLVFSKMLKEYLKANCVEIAIKKVNGFNQIKRYKTIYAFIFTSIIVGVGLTVFLELFVFNRQLIHLIIGTFLIVLDIIFVFSFYIKKIENKKIANILKGELLV